MFCLPDPVTTFYVGVGLVVLGGLMVFGGLGVWYSGTVNLCTWCIDRRDRQRAERAREEQDIELQALIIGVALFSEKI
ncbi:hypothetical protein F5883DRAFT_649416 [Diaporthe sp. PMI_573]|nr:hypothetical protein F5883DRAFT_649416 [Diaporthaceae sp. PMI_573]